MIITTTVGGIILFIQVFALGFQLGVLSNTLHFLKRKDNR